ncbi:helix-turn-helix domain-containing protein [Pedobacter jeongneungensis]
MSIGEHLRKKRMELRLLQRDLADILGVFEGCITYWETNRSEPQINYFPAIHLFLGYTHLKFDESTFRGQLEAYRWKNGLSHKRLGKVLGVHGSTIGSWENGDSRPNKENLEQLEMLFGK